MMVSGDTSSNGLPCPVEGKSIVSLIKFAMWNRGSVDNQLVISKNHGLTLYRNTKYLKEEVQ